MASYARQSDDTTLRDMCPRIQANAIRRCGELLQSIEPANGANQDIRGGDPPNASRTQAAIDAKTRQVRFHDLRHTAASLMIAGVPITVVAATLGHANTSTTLSIYAHALKGAETAGAQAMDAAYEGASATR